MPACALNFVHLVGDQLAILRIAEPGSSCVNAAPKQMERCTALLSVAAWYAPKHIEICGSNYGKSCRDLPTMPHEMPLLVCPPLPRRFAAMGEHAESSGFGLRLFTDIVAAVPDERPGHPCPHHGCLDIDAIGPA